MGGHDGQGRPDRSDFSNAPADEFNIGTAPSHPREAAGTGFLTLQRWIGAENPNQSVATDDLDNLALLQGAAYRAIGCENLSPWSKRRDRQGRAPAAL
jgi:hypothetical protein